MLKYAEEEEEEEERTLIKFAGGEGKEREFQTGEKKEKGGEGSK